jgi:hypothetical protein
MAVTNAPSHRRANLIRAACSTWVRENHPAVYEQFRREAEGKIPVARGFERRSRQMKGKVLRNALQTK